jgi:hypothetical protein
MRKTCDQKNRNDQNLIPLGILFKGSIANSTARMLGAICRLTEGIVDWLIWKMQKSMKK